MLTPQELREKTFEKAMFGGYDMGGVDNFLDTVAADYATLHNENSVLKSKMKVLVEKIEEYRATEDGMRKAILAVQKMSDEQVSEAKDKSIAMLQEADSRSKAMLEDAELRSGAMLREAEEKVAKMLREAQTEVAVEEAKLLEAKKSCAQYVERMRLLCTKQLDFFDKLGEISVPVSAPAQETKPGWDTVRSIEDSVSRLSDAPAEEVKPAVEKGAADATDEPTRLFDLDSLRFGDK